MQTHQQPMAWSRFSAGIDAGAATDLQCQTAFEAQNILPVVAGLHRPDSDIAVV